MLLVYLVLEFGFRMRMELQEKFNQSHLHGALMVLIHLIQVVLLPIILLQEFLVFLQVFIIDIQPVFGIIISSPAFNAAETAISNSLEYFDTILFDLLLLYKFYQLIR